MSVEGIKRVGGYVWRPAAGIVGLVVLIVWSSGACRPKVAPGRVAAEPGVAVAAGAPTFTVQQAPLVSRIDVVGTVASEQTINLSARLGAYVENVYVSAGDPVTNGQVLATLDDREIREQLAAAEAQLNQAQTEYERTRQLFEKAATTQQALTAAETQFNAARARVAQTLVMLSYARIVSPINGVVTDRRIEAGDLANPGQLLVAVYDPRRMRLEVPVPMRLIDKLKLNQKIDITVEGAAAPVPATVKEIVSEVDPQSRTQKVKIRIDNANAAVLPGMFGRVWVPSDAHPGMRVPASAVYRVGQLQMVQVVRDGRAVRRLVETGEAYGDGVEVLSGLQPGDVVLVHPVQEG
jgi:RND family efflux transporter MFP subunit